MFTEHSCACSQSRTYGFTLLELLVVLVIIGMMASFAVLQLGDRGADLAKKESQRLSLLVNLAREEAILQSREYALGFSKTGYAFYSLDEDSGEWSPVQGDGSLRERPMPEGLTYQLVIEDQLVELKKDLPKKPQAYLYSSGEMTPFSIIFQVEDFDSEPLELKFDELGRTGDEGQS